jgi:putative ABC transport system permease protein
MLRSYLAIALRHLANQRLYSAVNLAGLAIGIVCCLLIGLFVLHEWSYDRYHANADRIYRFSLDYSLDGGADVHLAAMAAPVAARLKQDFPQILETTQISRCGTADNGATFSTEDVTYYDTGQGMADNSVFQIFDFEWLHGDPATALLEPGTVVVTASTAMRYFGKTDALGETLSFENGTASLKVTGVIGDLPDNTHLNFSLLMSIASARFFLELWNQTCFHTYALVADGTDVGAIQAQAGEFFARHLPENVSAVIKNASFTVQPVTDIHLHSRRQAEMRPSGSLATVYTFATIAVFVLAIACINFMNLATARGAQRAKEVGVRKAVGGSRAQMIAQFLGESILITLIAVLLAMAIVELVTPAFEAFVQKDLSFANLRDPRVLAALAALCVLVGLAAGSYPAFYLSAFNPAQVLKGNVTRSTRAAAFRRVLVVIQFSISIALMIATATVFLQLRYARNIELGYDKDRIVVMTGSAIQGLGTQWEALKREWQSFPDVTGVTASTQVPATPIEGSTALRVEGVRNELPSASMLFVEFDFFETYGIDLLAGRTFDERFGTDRLATRGDASGRVGSFVLNAQAVRQLGLTPEQAVGRAAEVPMSGISGTIVGVVADTYFESIHSALKPLVYAVPAPPQQGNFATIREASIRITGNNLQDTLAHIDATWNRFLPDQAITRRFLDQDFQALYESEERQGQLFLYFSALAILIACLGLVGLASFATEQRTKEIGVRKVMGGTVLDIVRLFTGEFSKLVLLANLIAWPVAYFLMQRWLENFAYRIDMSFAVFVGSALLALVVALLTVGAIAARAARANPIRSLRYE